MGDKAVDGIGLVIGAGHQRVEQIAQTLGRIALQDERVEAVKGNQPGGADQGPRRV